MFYEAMQSVSQKHCNLRLKENVWIFCTQMHDDYDEDNDSDHAVLTPACFSHEPPPKIRKKKINAWKPLSSN